MSVLVMLDSSRPEGGKHSDCSDRPEVVSPVVEEMDAFVKARVGL